VHFAHGSSGGAVLCSFRIEAHLIVLDTVEGSRLLSPFVMGE
jgi:hypothetical protein